MKCRDVGTTATGQRSMNNYSFQIMHFHFPLKIYHLVLLPPAMLTGQVIISYIINCCSQSQQWLNFLVAPSMQGMCLGIPKFEHNKCMPAARPQVAIGLLMHCWNCTEAKMLETKICVPDLSLNHIKLNRSEAVATIIFILKDKSIG